MNNLRWKIGDVEIFQVVEVDNVGPAIQAAIPMATPENIKQIPWLMPNFADDQGILKSINQTFVIKSGRNIIVADTADGNGKIRSDAPEWSNFHTSYLNDLVAMGIQLEDVTTVVTSHIHTDHIGFNTLSENGKFIPTFPNAKYLFVKEDYDYWSSKPEKEMAADKEAFDDSVTPIVEAGLSEIVSNDYVIDEHVSFLPLPGHTPGHIGIVIESNGEKAILAGDAIHHPCQFAHPEWTMLADVDSSIAVQSRQKLLNDIANTDTILMATHFANPVAGKVVREGNSYKFKI